MNPDTLLHRQVHPSWVQLGRVTSQAFRPTPKDEKLLSVYDGDQITAEAAWYHFTNNLRNASVGVLAVTVPECNALQLPTVADPAHFPEHVVIDFSGYTEKIIKQKAKHLRTSAELRGWQYQAENSP
ncbi:MAG: hypothetical protein ACYDBT_00385 [Desulfobulbaceae bacterium]